VAKALGRTADAAQLYADAGVPFDAAQAYLEAGDTGRRSRTSAAFLTAIRSTGWQRRWRSASPPT